MRASMSRRALPTRRCCRNIRRPGRSSRSSRAPTRAQKKPDEAIVHLQKALEHDPDSVDVKILLASLLTEQGKPAEAQKYMDGIDMTKVKDPTVFLNQGINLINQGKAAEALPIFDKVVTAFPTNPEGYYYRGRCDLALGKFPRRRRTSEVRRDARRGCLRSGSGEKIRQLK